ncbi:hypothetical protein FHX77_000262 [Bifidobacterium commune]|uniref:hypothetical protein n=1 Tax=Bifidobacterium commune TaxID=1505727 RepID=UPI0011777F39|nr:hypothetical protein [Bifidobacterium commune]MBB2954882.1 hypothetical protein [Bifidobacterium commune]
MMGLFCHNILLNFSVVAAAEIADCPVLEALVAPDITQLFHTRGQMERNRSQYEKHRQPLAQSKNKKPALP